MPRSTGMRDGRRFPKISKQFIIANPMEYQEIKLSPEKRFNYIFKILEKWQFNIFEPSDKEEQPH